MTSKKWCITYFEVSQHESEDSFSQAWIDARKLDSRIKYFVGQQEISPSTGRVHFQGFVRWKSPIRLRQCKSWLDSDRVNVRIADGTDEQNKVYCTKEDSRVPNGIKVEWGTPSSQGNRSDVDHIKELILSGAPRRRLWEEHTGTMMRNYRGVYEMESYLRPMVEYDKDIKVELYYGPTGTGKTSAVFNRHGYPNVAQP